ncbi:MAG: molybdopterin dinucleotide binding domain-containing protein [Candidatus Hodarchaeota archaeon]
MDYILNVVRMVDYDQAKEFTFGDETSLEQNLAISFLNPEDYKRINLKTNINLKIFNENGEIIVKVEKKEEIPRGMIQMPVSIWSNQLTTVKDGEIIYKNIRVNIETSTNPISRFHDLIKKIKGSY